MKFGTATFYLICFYLLVGIHFGIWYATGVGNEVIFVKYYLFLSFLFIFVLTILSIIRRIYPNYVGFAFMGLMMFKLAVMFLVMKKLHLADVQGYKWHFIPPYLISLVLETLFAVNLIPKDPKDEKNQ